MVTKQMLKNSLETLGLHAGMNLIVHSSLSSFGYVEGGADTVIDVLQEILTEQGTLMMPSFNHGKPYMDGHIFDIKHTGTTSGIIPDTFWRRKGVLRSMNPTHSFAVWGKNAKRYTAYNHDAEAMGKGSPLSLLFEDDGYCMLMGVGYRSNTFHHYVETDIDAPCLSARGEVYTVRHADGTLSNAHTWGWRESNCPIDDSALYSEEMEKQGIHSQINAGESVVTLYRLKDGYRIIAKCLLDGYKDFPSCRDCTVKPRICKYTV
jgi:aminoglycoside 3-N-acetyltransferase